MKHVSTYCQYNLQTFDTQLYSADKDELRSFGGLVDCVVDIDITMVSTDLINKTTHHNCHSFHFG